MVKVLVVEDEASIREMMALNLRLAGMGCGGGQRRSGLPLLEQRPGCDAAILDVMLPALAMASRSAEPSAAPTRRSASSSWCQGRSRIRSARPVHRCRRLYDKPFSVSELLARVEALCRRVGRSAGAGGGKAAPASLVSGGLCWTRTAARPAPRQASPSS